MQSIIFLIIFSLTTLADSSLPSNHPPISSTGAKGAVVPETPITDAEQALLGLKGVAKNLDGAILAALPTQHNGRLKPLHTLARETLLFINGRYHPFSLDPVILFLALSVAPSSPYVNLIEIRDANLREQLGLLQTQKFASIADLERSPLLQIARPLIEKEHRNSRSVSPDERKVLDTYQQFSLARSVVDGSLFLQAIDFVSLFQHQEVASNLRIREVGQEFLQSISVGVPLSDAALPLISAVRNQPVPASLIGQLDSLEREVWYNKARIFFAVALYLFVLGCVLSLPSVAQLLPDPWVNSLLAIPTVGIALGLSMRVSITGFAPVTNMYGTMIWVALGMLVFSGLLSILYGNRALTGLLCIATALVLLLTESIPLVLSPDMDPIVAVLRSNYWLTIHVLTITISYAAFSIAMVVGNVALFRVLMFSPDANASFFKAYSHYAYRMIQLGVFLLTAGIILGGIWADYSWGRFWGWDPKETWALIADAGFLAILHARFNGWIKEFGLLASAPIAFLLVIMAWYGVNFILAAGLHSYGFSSGGAMAVGVFVALQLLLLMVAMGRYFGVSSSKKHCATSK